VIDRQLAQHPMMMTASAAASTETSAKYQGRLEDFPSLDSIPQSVQQADESQQPKQLPSTSGNPTAESAPRPGVSLAKKLAMSSRLSVRNGPMDFADFPSLSNSKVTKLRKGPAVSGDDFPSLSGISKADRGKTSMASAWNASDKGSTDDVRPSRRVGKANDMLWKNSNDFPSLASTVSDKTASLPVSSLPVNSLASISRNFSTGSLSKLSDQTDTVSNPPSLSREPELSRKSNDHKEKELKEHDSLLHSKKNKKSGKSTTQETWGGGSTSGGVTDRVKQATSTSKPASNPTTSAVKLPEAARTETTTGENDEESRDGASAVESPCWTRVGNEKLDSDDFPSLASTASISISDKTASLSVSSRNFSTGSLSKLSNRTDTLANPPSLSWGSELSQKSDFHKEKEPKEHDNLLHLKKNKTSGKSTAQGAWGGGQTSNGATDYVKQATSVSNTANIPTVPAVKVPEAAPAETTADEDDKESRDDASTAESPRWTHVGNGKKIQSKPSKKNDDAKKNGAKPPTNNANSEQVQTRKVPKSNTKSEEGHSQSKNAKDKSKKKQKTEKPQQESTVKKTSLNNAAKASIELDVDGSKSVPGASSETSEKLNDDVATGSDESVAGTERLAVGGTSCHNSAVNDEAMELVPIVDNNLTVDVTQLSAAAAVPVFNADDFPVLVQPLTQLSTLPSLPPGFSSLAASSSKPPPPPPGFSNPVVSRCPPPGLSSLLSSSVVPETSDAVGKTDGMDSEVSASKYIPPPDMHQRSAKLVGCISGAVKDGSFGEFRELSEKFRAGSISAGEYHGGCHDIMDSTAFLTIFPELIALLPDLPKQNQLLKVHRDFLAKSQQAEKTRSWCTAPEDGLVSCVVCGQVVCHADLQDHGSEHGTFNADYPTLPNTSLCSVR